MLVDLKVGVGDASCRVKQSDGWVQYGRAVGHCQGALPSAAGGLGVGCGSCTAASTKP
jgi:hypothetical protein